MFHEPSDHIKTRNSRFSTDPDTPRFLRAQPHPLAMAPKKPLPVATGTGAITSFFSGPIQLHRHQAPPGPGRPPRSTETRGRPPDHRRRHQLRLHRPVCRSFQLQFNQPAAAIDAR